MADFTDEDGLIKEIKVLHALRAYGAVVQTSYHADHHEKNDYRIVKINGPRRLFFHVLVQLTRQLDDLEKLKKWFHTRRENNSINLYAQIEGKLSPEAIAQTIIDKAFKLVPGSYVLYIKKHGSARVLSPLERAREIAVHLLSLREKYKTAQGLVTLVRDCEIHITTEKGETFLSYNSDIKDPRLFRLIRKMRRTRSGVQVPPVKFLATTEGRPMFRARDVMLDVPVEAVEPEPSAPEPVPEPTPEPKPVEPKKESLPFGAIGWIDLQGPSPLPGTRMSGKIMKLYDGGFIIVGKDNKQYWSTYEQVDVESHRWFTNFQGSAVKIVHSEYHRVWFTVEDGRKHKYFLASHIMLKETILG